VPRARYVLTARAAADLREARAWSRARWGKELTSRYFDDLHEGAQFIAENQSALRPRQELSGGTIDHCLSNVLMYRPEVMLNATFRKSAGS